ncbi:hypothetical protein MCEMAEM4_03375 [Burkholderiaceae bacterium]
MRNKPTLAPPKSCWPTTPLTTTLSVDVTVIVPPAAVSSVPPETYWLLASNTKVSTSTATLLMCVPAVMVNLSLADIRPSIQTWLREVIITSPPTSGADTLPRNQMLPSLLSVMLPSGVDSLSRSSAQTAVVLPNLPVGSDTMALARDMSMPTPRVSLAA